MRLKLNLEMAVAKMLPDAKLPWFAVLVVFVSTLSGGAQNVIAGSPVLVGKRVAAGAQMPMHEIDHSDWEELLEKYVDARGMVNYRGWKASSAAVQKLDGYLNHLSSASWNAKTPKEAKLAFWINAYNAVTVKGILREYPTSSIRNHTARFIGYNIWKDLKLQIGSRVYSLDEIEHDILRKMSEPRIHFAIVCASISCPKLQPWAFTKEKIDAQLTQSANEFFQDSTKCQFDVAKSEVRLSQILNWFDTDFGKDRDSQLRFVATYSPRGTRALLLSGEARVSYLKYDWGLNDQ
ncbi:MAG: DUF547 domain-containing protein [Planctomycetota bacterium]